MFREYAKEQIKITDDIEGKKRKEKERAKEGGKMAMPKRNGNSKLSKEKNQRKKKEGKSRS